MTILGLAHVQLAGPPGCEERARAYFGRLLGLQELSKPDELAARGGVWFACGSQEIHIGIDPDFKSARKAHPAFAVSDLAGLRQRLYDAGWMVQDGEEMFGMPRFYTHDPFGNRIEFVQS
jgi:catechol 2,3-dioxygenase-like lactoylglutathione lyase family enzyme